MNPGGLVDPLGPEVTLVHVSCAVCQNEIPFSEVVVPEATDYLVYLCGLDCYHRWRESSGYES